MNAPGGLIASGGIGPSPPLNPHGDAPLRAARNPERGSGAWRKSPAGSAVQAPSGPIRRLRMPMSKFSPLSRLGPVAASIAGLVLLCCSAVVAAPVQVPDAREWARLTPQQQAVRRAEIKRQLQQASPDERRAFRLQLREQLESLTPAQRQALIDDTRSHWHELTPAQRNQLADERRRQVQAMTPAERRELLRQRREMLGKLSPEERRAWRERLDPD